MARKRAIARKPSTHFERLQGRQWDLPRCFIVHLWSPDYILHVIEHIRHGLRGRFYVEVDQDFGAGEPVRLQALDAIRRSSLVVVILDDLAPNVVFELGYAYALAKGPRWSWTPAGVGDS